MNRLVPTLAVMLLVLLSGCLGGGVVDETALSEEATYDWNTTADGSVTVANGSYEAVLSLDNQTNVSLFGPGEFGGEAPLRVSAVKYRYGNGTIVNASQLTVVERDERTVIEVPRQDGQLGYTAEVQSSTVYVPVAINGSYSLTLPPGTDVRAPIIGQATPRDFAVEETVNRITLHWEHPETDSIVVDYYSEQNVYVFAGLLALAGVIALAGFLYFRAQIQALASERRAFGPDDLDE